MNDIASLIERLRKASEAWHDEAHALYGEAAEALSLSVSPLPEEIAAITKSFRSRASDCSCEGCVEIRTAASALERMARENERLRGECAIHRKAVFTQMGRIHLLNEDLKQHQAENERLQRWVDAIRAKTMEDACTAVAGILPIGGLLAACQRVIRALNQPPASSGEGVKP